MKLSRLMTIMTVVLPLTLTLSAGDAFAQKKKKKKKKKGEKAGEMSTEGGGGGSYKAPPYGMAGCGLGSMVMKSNTKGAQSSAALTNGYTFSTLLGITSGTSNCVETDAETAAVEREVYISANLASLSKEAAQGEGDHLLAFADVLGCADSGLYPHFVKVSKEQHGEIFHSEDPLTVLSSYMNALKADNQLKSACNRIGV